MEKMIYGHATASGSIRCDQGKQQFATSAQRVANTPLSEMSAALIRVSDVADRVYRLAERICGPIPQNPSTDANCVYGGLVGAIEGETHTLHGNVSRINEALTRIEEALS